MVLETFGNAHLKVTASVKQDWFPKTPYTAMALTVASVSLFDYIFLLTLTFFSSFSLKGLTLFGIKDISTKLSLKESHSLTSFMALKLPHT